MMPSGGPERPLRDTSRQLREVAGLILASGSFALAPAQTVAAGVDVSGQWVGTYAYQDQSRGAGTVTAAFQQDGEKLSGDLTMYNPGGAVYTVVGFVAGNEIKLTQPAFGTLKGNQIIRGMGV
jgi:hypothetical protein